MVPILSLHYYWSKHTFFTLNNKIFNSKQVKHVWNNVSHYFAPAVVIQNFKGWDTPREKPPMTRHSVKWQRHSLGVKRNLWQSLSSRQSFFFFFSSTGQRYTSYRHAWPRASCCSTCVCKPTRSCYCHPSLLKLQLFLQSCHTRISSSLTGVVAAFSNLHQEVDVQNFKLTCNNKDLWHNARKKFEKRGFTI